MWVTIMRKLFHTTAALSVLLATSMAANAADVPPYAPPPPVYAPPVYVPPAFFSWTGFYLGGTVGGAWRHASVTDTLLGLTFSNGNKNTAFIGRGHLGFTYKLGNFVRAGERDFDGVANTNNTRPV